MIISPSHAIYFKASHWPPKPPPCRLVDCSRVGGLVEVSATDSEESLRPTRKSPKNKELFWIAYMDRPRVGGAWLVDWCTRRPSLKNNELFQIAPMKGSRVGGVQLVDWCICGPTCRALKTRSRSKLKILVLLSASVERFCVSRMRDFFLSKYY